MHIFGSGVPHLRICEVCSGASDPRILETSLSLNPATLNPNPITPRGPRASELPGIRMPSCWPRSVSEILGFARNRCNPPPPPSKQLFFIENNKGECILLPASCYPECLKLKARIFILEECRFSAGNAAELLAMPHLATGLSGFITL